MMGLLAGTLYPADPRRICCPACSFWELPQILAPLLGGGALHGTAVRLALIIMAAARTGRRCLAGDRPHGGPLGLTTNTSARA